MQKIMPVIGTRPEAIKLAPVIKELERYPEEFKVVPVVTAQHREMLDQVLHFFDISSAYDLDIMENNQSLSSSKFILVTAHRRENFGEPLQNICLALKEIIQANHNIEAIYPVHLNPNVREPVNRILKDNERIHLISPLDYESFVWLMEKSYLILTDSGGVQGEAPSLGKPVLVLREVTERPEAVEAGTVRAVGLDKDKIVQETQKLLDDKVLYEKMSQAANPYGDGKASKKIMETLGKSL